MHEHEHDSHDDHHHPDGHGNHVEHASPQPDEEDTCAGSSYRVLEIALRELLIDKGIISAAELRSIHEKMDQRGPANGARMVARAWVDPTFRDHLRRDATAAARELGLEPTWLKLIVVENTANLHNLVVCTLCSCYPWPLLGLPPDWYKSRAYRAGAVQRPRALLKQFGTELPDGVELRVHDSTADMRYLVMPARPDGTDGWSEEALARLVTRDSMIGVTTALLPAALASADQGAPA